MRPAPPRPTERVIMLTLTSPTTTRILGALEDGTLFERDPAAGWRTINGPGDPDESFDLLTTIVSAAERGGARLRNGPVDFGIDTATCNAIRNDRWTGIEPALLIGYNMASRTTH